MSAFKHGASVTAAGRLVPEYTCWQGMRARCLQASNPAYRYYGGRGISICERWNDFSLFLADMGRRPSSDHSIDRIDVNGNYEPGNCRWATKKDQARNTRTARMVTFRGATRPLNDWADEIGICRTALIRRIRDWGIEEALTRPKEDRGPLTLAVITAVRSAWSAGGVTQRALANEYGLNQSTISRILKGQRTAVMRRVWKSEARE